jgi:hypothetical protein
VITERWPGACVEEDRDELPRNSHMIIAIADINLRQTETRPARPRDPTGSLFLARSTARRPLGQPHRTMKARRNLDRDLVRASFPPISHQNTAALNTQLRA